MKKNNKVIPEDMVYLNKSKRKLLFNNIYKGYHYYIISMGTHPCAYIEITNKHADVNKIENNIICHGGITYIDHYLYTSYNTLLKGNLFIGWDYAHLGDYLGWLMHNPELLEGCKQWKTEEIINDCESVINQLIEMEMIK